jgi:hypothetical protein
MAGDAQRPARGARGLAMDQQTMQELAKLRHDISNLEFVINDEYYPKHIRETCLRLRAEKEAERQRVYTRAYMADIQGLPNQ